MKTTEPRCLGESHDGRTQRWMIICPSCGKEFQPITTRLATQEMECPKKKCQASLIADYNAEPPVVKIARGES